MNIRINVYKCPELGPPIAFEKAITQAAPSATVSFGTCTVYIEVALAEAGAVIEQVRAALAAGDDDATVALSAAQRDAQRELAAPALAAHARTRTQHDLQDDPIAALEAIDTAIVASLRDLTGCGEAAVREAMETYYGPHE